MVFQHRRQEWFPWFHERRSGSGSAYHVCSLSVIVVLQKVSSPHVRFIIKKIIMQWRNIHMPKTTRASPGFPAPWSPVNMIWQYVVLRPLWTACVSSGTVARVKAMEQTEYVYCVLDRGELHLPKQWGTMRLCHKQGSLHATTNYYTINAYIKILENTRVHSKGYYVKQYDCTCRCTALWAKSNTN
jgi:hypothetical protein